MIQQLQQIARTNFTKVYPRNGFLKSPIPAYRLFQWKTTPHPFFTYGPHNTVWETLHHTCDIIAEKPKHFVIPTHIIEQIQHMDMNNIALIQTHPIEIYMHKMWIQRMARHQFLTQHIVDL